MEWEDECFDDDSYFECHEQAGPDSPRVTHGSVAYSDSIVKPIEDYAQSIFATDKPRYERILEICQRLRTLIK